MEPTEDDAQKRLKSMAWMRREGVSPDDVRELLKSQGLAEVLDPAKAQHAISEYDAFVGEYKAPEGAVRASRRTWAEHLAETHFEHQVSRHQAAPYKGGFENTLRVWRQRVMGIFREHKADALAHIMAGHFSGGNYAEQMAILEPLFHESEPAGSIAGINTKGGYTQSCFRQMRLRGMDSYSTMKVAFLTWHALMHHNAGKRVYQVDRALGEALMDTSLRGLEGSDIRLPYSSIYLQPPDMQHPMLVYNHESHWHRVTGIYISGDHALTDSGRAKWRAMDKSGMYDPSVPLDLQVQEFTDYTRVLQFLVVGENKSDNLTGPPDDALYWFSVRLEPKSFLECTRHRVGGILAPGHQAHPQMTDELLRIAEWSANVLMYTTCANPGEKFASDKASRALWERIKKLPPKSAKRKRLLNEVRGRDPRERILLKQANIVVDRSRAPGEATGVGSGRKVSVRTKVAGHYRTVRIGPGRTGRRHRWIEPFWRGPEMGEIVAKRHVLR